VALGIAAVLAGFSLLLSACSSTPPVLPPERVVGEVEEYEIGVPDLLTIHVWKQPEISGEVVVRPDGKISLPLLQDVQAEGLTPDELRQDIAEQLGEYIVAPQVNVAVKEMRSNTASVVGGGVARSGVVPLMRNTRVLDAIASMGGFTPFAKKGDILVLRESSTGQVDYQFDYDAFISGKSPNSNMLLEPGDTIVVPD
jgi:polysaccharide export outer membrane protein